VAGGVPDPALPRTPRRGYTCRVPVLVSSELSKAFGPQIVLDNVALSIEEGERIGLVGVNGSGKSTLARIVAGVEQADGGNIAVRSDAHVAYLPQEPSFDPARTVRQIAAEGLGEWMQARERHDAAVTALSSGKAATDSMLAQQADAAADVDRLGGWDRMYQVDTVLDHLGLHDPGALVSTLSGGELRRLAIAQILVSRPDLAILDEPTNHLDVETIEWLERYFLEEFRGALLLITHDRYVLDRVAQRTLELDRGRLFSYDGGYEDYLEAKAERLALENRTESNRQNFLRTELEWLGRQPKARSTKQKARIARAIEAVQTLAPPTEGRVNLSMDGPRTGKTILELHDLRLRLGDKLLVDKLNLLLGKGERIGIVGRNGTGKTTLLRAILGQVAPESGHVVVGTNSKLAYFDQARSGLDDARSIFDNVGEGSKTIQVSGRPVEVTSYLGRFLFDASKQRQPVGSLSGGERARVALAILMRDGGNVVLLDEPTNDLDVATLSALEEMLLESEGTALVVTHDRWFLDRVATSLLVFEGDGRVVLYPGNYETWRRLKAEQAAREAEEQAARATPQAKPMASARPPKPKSKALTWSEQRELEGIMDRIEQAEAEVGELEEKLADPSLYSQRSGEIASLKNALERAKEAASALTSRWEELESRAAAARED